MSREAVKWSYGNAVVALGLSAPELAVLRALCWRTDARLGHCPRTTDKDLTALTGYAERKTFTEARKRLRELGLVSYERERRASDRETGRYGTSNGYVYFVHLETGEDGAAQRKAAR